MHTLPLVGPADPPSIVAAVAVDSAKRFPFPIDNRRGDSAPVASFGGHSAGRPVGWDTAAKSQKRHCRDQYLHCDVSEVTT